jgi:hypothetical protein
MGEGAMAVQFVHEYLLEFGEFSGPIWLDV